jgi:hypothetical protein
MKRQQVRNTYSLNHVSALQLSAQESSVLAVQHESNVLAQCGVRNSVAINRRGIGQERCAKGRDIAEVGGGVGTVKDVVRKECRNCLDILCLDGGAHRASFLCEESLESGVGRRKDGDVLESADSLCKFGDGGERTP